jgi:hypothetical protein
MEAVATPTVSASAREVLAATIDRNHFAEAALESACIAANQARAAVVAAGSHLAQFSDLDKRIAATRAEMVKCNDTGTLPNSLIAERNARHAARETLEECNGALALLEAEQVAAEKDLRDAAEAVSVAALHVMLDEAGALSEGLRATQQQQWRLADSLYALDLVVSAATGALPGGQKAAIRQRLWRLLEPLNMRRPDLPPAAPAYPLRLHTARWRTLHAELRRNAEVQVQQTWEK